MILPKRPDLAGLEPYGAPQLDVPVCLNTNENPYPPGADVVADMAAAAGTAATKLNRYPDREFSALRQDLADYLAVESGVRIPAENVWAANGSNEVMLHMLQAFAGPGRTVATFLPSYSMYPEYARDTFSRWVTGPRNSDFSLNMDDVEALLRAERPAVLLLASPNNPTGTALPREELEQVLEIARTTGPAVGPAAGESATIVVVDEAYGEFRRDGVPSALELLADNPHMVVSRTMSKAFGAAGLRLGYLAAATDIIEQIMLVRLPYHLSATTQAVARAALAHRDSLMAQVANMRNHRDQLAEDLKALGLAVAPSDANFIMFGKFPDRRAVWQSLLDRGVLIREVGPDGWLRVSIGTEEENAAFLAALREVIA